jgi:hypothetical protein
MQSTEPSPVDHAPRVVIRYFEAMNRFDAVAAAECFTVDARLEDQFGPHVGRPAIQHWMLTIYRDYQITLLPLRRVASSADASMTVSVSGRFPGSPVEVDFHFRFRGRKIVRLTIDG